jgi:hypothetical protein
MQSWSHKTSPKLIIAAEKLQSRNVIGCRHQTKKYHEIVRDKKFQSMIKVCF